MGDEKRSYESTNQEDGHISRHPVAYAALAGAALGVTVGMLVAPRKGSDLRKEVGVQLIHVKDGCASGLKRAKDKASDWGKKGHHAYESTTKIVGKSARETGRYLSDVAGAVTMKSRRQAEALVRQPEMAKTTEQASKAPEHATKTDLTSPSTAERARPSLAVKSS